MDSKTCIALSTGVALGAAISFAAFHAECFSKSFSLSQLCPYMCGKRTSNALAKMPVEIDLTLPDKDNFMAVYDELVKAEREENIDIHGAQIVDWIKDMSDYNVPGGKLNRGLAVVASAKILDPKEMQNRDTYIAACILGWGIEFLQAFFLIADDIMDHSVTRRGHPCWYKVEKVKLIAVNDCCILEATIYRFLRKYLSHLPCYLEILELFHDVKYATTIGQLMDMLTVPEGENNFEYYTLDRYKLIVTWKTAFYTFYLPTACAMHLCGVKDKSTFDTARKICLMLGEFFQIQDDYLDCYGDPAVIGKIGTDIEDNKCGWLVCQALKRASKLQLATLHSHYGKVSKDSVAKVKAIFQNLKVKELFEAHEDETHARIALVVASEVPATLRPIYNWHLGKIFKRSK
jgi:farnesyl diphosphate synthase